MSQETPISAAVTDFVVTTDSRIYEDEMLDLAKRCLVDWIGVSIGGTVEALDPVIPSVKRGRDGALPVAQPCSRRQRNEAAEGINALPRCSVCAAYLTPQVIKHEWHDQSSTNWESWRICCHLCYLAWLEAGGDF